MNYLRGTVLLMLLSLNSFAGEADGKASAESEVLQALIDYMDARNSRDFKRVIELSSKSGTLDTNSDGSFHKPLALQTMESWEKSGPAQIVYFYPEASQISEGVVHVRFYAEGMIGGAGDAIGYRTRVTMNWVNEGGNWVIKSSHYSPATYGGVHQTQVSDFDN